MTERTKEEFLAIVRQESDLAAIDKKEGRPTRSAIGIAAYSDFHGAKIHYLHNSIGWTPEPKHKTKQKKVDVPVGFVTDFASVPKMFWSILPPSGTYTQAAIVHDFMYWFQDDMGWTKSDADEVFDHMMGDLEVKPLTRNAIILAVENLGRPAWNNNASLKSSGEKRILKKFPSDPLTTWEQWKSDPANFK
jgi:hypothetical protein